MFGHINQTHNILDSFSDPLVSLVTRGMKVNVQIAKEDGGVSPGALVPSLFDCC